MLPQPIQVILDSGPVMSRYVCVGLCLSTREQGQENYSSGSPPLGVQYRLGPAVSSNVRGSCCGLSLEREAGRKGPAHQVFVNGLPEECPSCLMASHPAESTKPTVRQEPICRVRSTQAHLQTTQITQELCTGIHLHTHKGSHAHTCTK